MQKQDHSKVAQRLACQIVASVLDGYVMQGGITAYLENAARENGIDIALDDLDRKVSRFVQQIAGRYARKAQE